MTGALTGLNSAMSSLNLAEKEFGHTQVESVKLKGEKVISHSQVMVCVCVCVCCVVALPSSRGASCLRHCSAALPLC
jgi:hypothetical protein